MEHDEQLACCPVRGASLAGWDAVEPRRLDHVSSSPAAERERSG
jgi:hypothetical protein